MAGGFNLAAKKSIKFFAMGTESEYSVSFV